MLGGSGAYPRFVANALRDLFGDFPIVIEQPRSRFQLVRRRVSRLGYLATTGQVLYVQAIYRPLQRSSRDRIQEIRREYSLDDSPITGDVRFVSSVNDDATIQMVQEVQPEIIAVMGTRILSKRLLSSIHATFINLHGGITPGFRGCHGAYWALATGHPELARRYRPLHRPRRWHWSSSGNRRTSP